jgi:hypothetical protein
MAAFLMPLKLDARDGARLFPLGSSDPRTVHGAGYATLFLFYAATLGLTVYGPAVLQTLRGLSALAAGYVVSAEALSWTATALPVAGLTGALAKPLIRLGAVAILVGLACCALVVDGGNLALVAAAAGLIGVGVGLSYAFITQGILGALAGAERAIGGAGIATIRPDRSGGGLGDGRGGRQSRRLRQWLHNRGAPAAGVWVFLAALPVARWPA